MAENQIQTMDGGQAVAELPAGTITLPPALHGMLEMPAAKQMGLIFSLGAAIALVILVGVWSISPAMTPLYTSLDAKDSADISAALMAAGIEYDLNSTTGMVMVGKDKLHDARLKMAALGLPKKASMRGMEQLSEEQGFGTSQFVEAARYHHALETELSRTISSLRNVRSARVHLALPKQSIFVRDRILPSASVVVDLLGGEGINGSSVASIVHLVSSSVPHLSSQQVTVVDQSGRLLSDSTNKNNTVAMSSKQYQYTRNLEMDLVRRIEMLLTPIIGVGKVRAEVNAELDFDVIESTTENYDPEKRIVRSEQTSENRKASANEAEGIPGALANKPPGDAELTENTDITDLNKTGVINSSRDAVRNFELDKTISHTKRSNGKIKRLSVAVVVDHALLPVIEAAIAAVPGAPVAAAPAAAGAAVPATAPATAKLPEKEKLERRELNAEEIARLTALIQEVVGFNELRGDSVNIISAPFLEAETLDAIELPFYEQNWFWPAVKQGGGALLVLYVLFGILKPSLRNLSNYRPPVVINSSDEEGVDGERAEGADGIEGEIVRDENGEIIKELDKEIPLPDEHDNKVDFAQKMVQHDPRRVAKVVKEWVANG